MLESTQLKGNAKRVLVVVLAVGLIGAAMGAVTFSYFQDTDTSSSNTIESGTLNVTIGGVDDGTSNDFAMTSATPLNSTSKNYSLANGGSASADHLQINISVNESDPSGYDQEPGDSDLKNELNASETAKYIEVTKLTYHDGTSSTDLNASISDANGNGIVDLADVQNHSAMDDLTPPKAEEGNQTHFDMTVRIASDDHGLSDDDEDIMGDGINVSVHFTLMQDSSQDAI